MRLPRQRTGGPQGPTRLHGDHAVVLGASMAGLLAARVLADHFAQVTLVERDRLSNGGRTRRGVPQARHAHVLLPRGSKILEELFPGILQQMVDAGVPVGDSLDQFHMNLGGHLFFRERGARGSKRDGGAGLLYEPSRPFLERLVLDRVRELPNVDLLDGCDVGSPLTDRGATRVTGVQVTPHEVGSASLELRADLVACATGRNGRAGTWLRGMGYAPPPEEQVPVDLKYVTQRVRFPEGRMDHRRTVLIGGVPERPTGCGAFAQEGGEWVVTFAGYGGHHPPLDRESWLAFGEEFLPRDFAEALRDAEQLDELHAHRFPANLRRRYDKLTRFPDGFLVVGDALCSFNPIYGQGMTVSALEALALGDALAQGRDDLALRFFKAAAKPIGNAWRLAVGNDLGMPADVVEGPRPLPVRAANSYIDRFQTAAERDPVMAWRFLDVTGFEYPLAALFSPDSLRRVASEGRRPRRTPVGAGAEVTGQWP